MKSTSWSYAPALMMSIGMFFLGCHGQDAKNESILINKIVDNIEIGNTENTDVSVSKLQEMNHKAIAGLVNQWCREIDCRRKFYACVALARVVDEQALAHICAQIEGSGLSCEKVWGITTMFLVPFELDHRKDRLMIPSRVIPLLAESLTDTTEIPECFPGPHQARSIREISYAALLQMVRFNDNQIDSLFLSHRSCSSNVMLHNLILEWWQKNKEQIHWKQATKTFESIR